MPTQGDAPDQEAVRCISHHVRSIYKNLIWSEAHRGMMKINSGIIFTLGIIYLSISGCLYRGDGVFKKIGDTDYKAKINVMNLFVAADGRPTYICGAVLLEDHITPLRNTRIILKKKDQQAIVSNTVTDNTGAFNMTGLFSNDYYTLEIDSPDYFVKKTITVEPKKNNWHDLYANKR